MPSKHGHPRTLRPQQKSEDRGQSLQSQTKRPSGGILRGRTVRKSRWFRPYRGSWIFGSHIAFSCMSVLCTQVRARLDLADIAARLSRCQSQRRSSRSYLVIAAGLSATHTTATSTSAASQSLRDAPIVIFTCAGAFSQCVRAVCPNRALISCAKAETGTGGRSMINRALCWVMSLHGWSLRLFFLVSGVSLLGWLLFFGRHYFPLAWEAPLLAAAAVLIGLKLGGFILLTGAALAIKAFRWLRPT